MNRRLVKVIASFALVRSSWGGSGGDGNDPVACCTSTTSAQCINSTRKECRQDGGSVDGDPSNLGQRCDDSTCQSGACCLGGGNCKDTFEADCLSGDSDFIPNAQCFQGVCDVGACRRDSNDNCTDDELRRDCAFFGTFLGANTSCAVEGQFEPGYGCDDKDDNDNGEIDECAEDLFPPEVNVSRAVEECASGQVFETLADMQSCVNTQVDAEDDCQNVTTDGTTSSSDDCLMSLTITAKATDCVNETGRDPKLDISTAAQITGLRVKENCESGVCCTEETCEDGKYIWDCGSGNFTPGGNCSLDCVGQEGACCLEGGECVDELQEAACESEEQQGGTFLGTGTSCDDEDGNICKAVKPCGKDCIADLQCDSRCCLTPDQLRFHSKVERGRRELSPTTPSSTTQGKCIEKKWCECSDQANKAKSGAGVGAIVKCVTPCLSQGRGK